MLYRNLTKSQKLYKFDQRRFFINALRPFKNNKTDEQKIVIHCIPKTDQTTSSIRMKQDDSLELIIPGDMLFSFICLKRGVLIKTSDGKEHYIPYNIKEFNGKTLKSIYKIKIIKILATYFDLEKIDKKFQEIEYVSIFMFTILIITISISFACGYILKTLL